MNNNLNNRIYGFDILRFLMILCVIMLHAAMTFMEYVPTWWYVIDNNKSLYFTILVVFLDSFPMSVLFFLAGYFAPISLNKYGKIKFIKAKILRIFIPWLLGVILVAPFFAYATFRAFLPVMPNVPDSSFFYFVTHYFISFNYHGSFYQQGHYWFLNVLFAFFILYAIFASRLNKIKNLNFALVFFLTALFYFLSSRFLMPTDDWFNILCFIYFQPARVIGYAVLFILGIKAYNQDWFNSGYKPDLFLWGVISLISAILLLSRKFIPSLNFDLNINLILDAVFYSLFSVSAVIFLTGLFAKIRTSPSGVEDDKIPSGVEDDKRPPELLNKISRASYGIYWLHQILLMPFLWLITPFNIPILFKWALGVIFTVITAWLINDYIFKKILKKLAL